MYDFENIKALMHTGDIENIELALQLSEHFFKPFYDFFMSLQITVQRWIMHLNKFNVKRSKSLDFDCRLLSFFERKAKYKGFSFGFAAYLFTEHHKIGQRSDYNICTCGAVKGKCFIPELPMKCEGLPF